MRVHIDKADVRHKIWELNRSHYGDDKRPQITVAAEGYEMELIIKVAEQKARALTIAATTEAILDVVSWRDMTDNDSKDDDDG